MNKRQANNIFHIIEPCLKSVKGRYSTLYGNKTKEGLIETIVNAGNNKGEYIDESKTNK